MSNIDTVAPNNNFSDIQKNSLTTFIKLLSNNELPADKHKFIGLLLLTVSTYVGNANLLTWILDNNYAHCNDLINNYHIKFLNKLGFNFELQSTNMMTDETKDEMPELISGDDNDMDVTDDEMPELISGDDNDMDVNDDEMPELISGDDKDMDETTNKLFDIPPAIICPTVAATVFDHSLYDTIFPHVGNK